MISVDGLNVGAGLKELVGLLLEVDRDNGVAILSGEANDRGAISLMDCYLAIGLTETNDLVARDGMALRTSAIGLLGSGGEEVAKETLGLIGEHMIQPIGLGLDVVVGIDFNTVATRELCLNGADLAIDASELGMAPQHAVNLEGKVQHGGTLGQYDGSTLRGKDHDVVVVERCGHILQKPVRLALLCQVFEHGAEPIEPEGNVHLTSACEAAKTGVVDHLLTAYVHLFPLTMVGEELDVEATVAVALGVVYIIGYATRLFAEPICEQGVEP